MKIQLLGFIPLLLWAALAHYVAYRDYIKYKDVWKINDAAAVGTMVFWMFVTAMGIVWGLGGL